MKEGEISKGDDMPIHKTGNCAVARDYGGGLFQRTVELCIEVWGAVGVIVLNKLQLNKKIKDL